MYKTAAFFILPLRSTIVLAFIILRSSYRLALEIIKSSSVDVLLVLGLARVLVARV